MIKDTKLHKHAKHLFLSNKPAPALVSHFEQKNRFALSSLSHILDREIQGYKQLPEWTEDPSDPQLRNFEEKVFVRLFFFNRRVCYLPPPSLASFCVIIRELFEITRVQTKRTH
jgi:hypothetical protein